MRRIFSLSLSLTLLFGCGKNDKNTRERESISLDDLAVTISDSPRSYFLSDKRGAFLIGRAGQGTEPEETWSVDGQIILQDIGQIAVDGRPVSGKTMDSVRVTPLEVVRYFHDGTTVTLLPLDRVLTGERAHALAVQIQTPSPHDVRFALQPGSEFASAPQGEGEGATVLYKRKSGGTLACSAGGQGEISGNGTIVKRTSKAVFAVVYAPVDSADHLARRVQEEVELLRLARRDRMERLLTRAYLRTSDAELTKAFRWLQLTLDGLTIESPDTTAVAALPWDGTSDARSNAVAIAGLDIATGNYSTQAGMLRSLTRQSDRSTDGGAWFAREAYEHVIASGDTALVRQLFPAVLTRIAGAQKQTDLYNFLPLQSGDLRGSRIAEQQGLWYSQQTIGSIFAAFLSDSTHAAQWAIMADLTSSAFNKMFIDTSRSVVYGRLAPNGHGSPETGPGALVCLDMIESEAVRQNTVKSVTKALLRPYGLATHYPSAAEAKGDGIIENWMIGQMIYGLTRYDCQHISYPVTRRLARRVLTTDMVGALPEMYEGNAEARAAGAPVSLAAAAEFIRSFYQDYLGVRVNMTTRLLAIEPKLPDELTDVDFTIFAGSHPVVARYNRNAESDHVVLRGEGLTDSLRVTFLWVIKNGDAWRGATWLCPGSTTTLLFGERDATGLCDGKEMPLENLRHLVGFSQRSGMEGL